ncbi:hypothetical protein V8F06_010274 [Rhypophila decipiens]
MQDMFLALKRTMVDLISHNDSVLVEKKVLYWDDESFNNRKTWHYAYGPPISTTTGGLHKAFENSIQEVHQDPFYNPESYFRITIRSYGHDQQGLLLNAEATAHTQKMKNLKRRIRMHTENKADPIAKCDGFRVTTRDAKIRYLKQATRIFAKELKLGKKVRNLWRALEAGRLGKLAQAKKKDNAKLNKGVEVSNHNHDGSLKFLEDYSSCSGGISDDGWCLGNELGFNENGLRCGFV